jgi:PemK-like, MazF-like toxin of type II toxin-antitoxin system
MQTLIQGRIVWATVPDPQGRNPKDRPLVIMTENPKDASENDDLIVVAVTTQAHEAPPEHCVALPWSRSPGCATKLTGPSVAVCSWLCQIKRSEVRKIGGLVNDKVLQEILSKIAELQKGTAPNQGKPPS